MKLRVHHLPAAYETDPKFPSSCYETGALTIADIVPVLFTLCVQKEVKVYEVKTGLVQLSFRRWLTDELQQCWDVS